MPYITFSKKPSARTGNILFQYLFCKIISIRFGYTYIPIENFPQPDSTTDFFRINDDNSTTVFQYKDSNAFNNLDIMCDGFFQNSDFYLPYRDEILDSLYNVENLDYWIGCKGNKQSIKDFITCSHKYTETLSHRDVVVSLRLDDFIQSPCPTSDIIPPQHYLSILENLYFDKLYIVCDTIRHHWEHTYIQFFEKWSPILIQEDLMHDCAIMMDCNVLLHSNSTLCWFMSFISRTKHIRYIPNTNFYKSQKLKEIESTDVLINVSPMTHHDVYNIHTHPFIKQSIHTLAYCIPDECIIDTQTALNSNKHIIISDLIPGQLHTYRFSHDQENEYNQMYQESLFAYTHKKGGWDCLRHYEIMANGCIPIFWDIDKCPASTLVTFPKKLIQDANIKLLPWKPEYMPLYRDIQIKMLHHMREHCSTSATAKYFLKKMSEVNNREIHNVLLVMGNCGVNYTRETFWIGLKRHIQSIGGCAVEYPKIDFLYSNYKGEKRKLYGNGFTYAYMLQDDYSLSHETIIENIKNKFWDIIIYGKVGPDELHEGSLPHMPLWEHVFKRYSKNEIAFLYGGDGCQDMRNGNPYSGHIINHARYAQCFVRELLY